MSFPRELAGKGKRALQRCRTAFVAILQRIADTIAALLRLIQYGWNHHVRGIAIDAPPIFIVGCGHSGSLLAELGHIDSPRHPDGEDQHA